MASQAEAQFNWNFCPCLQDARKTAFLIKAVSGFNMLIEWNRKQTKRTGTLATHAP
jgi:hypothetical protein